ncbi:phosphoribosylamine--glycine ligase [Parvularcula dongshanensis]|uniref:Phosphoribosylamine--glycine ligase n=1 Tax=Parvularcula dongshanensis TaxID=1173995 RepID=A0A840I6I2_9PROT|nr:phosphoribosylamine--glycine ligase [Parvularcula dongshanensis]MBB4659738.1 phosphoribosylamine--glycine ligase [Parvularcula dongshanensis]
MDILLIGSGGREHALAWKIAKSPLVGRLVCAPGNPGIANVADCVPLPEDVAAYAKAEGFHLVVVGPEQPLAEGLADACEAAGVACFGPSKAAAQLETSKAFVKALCREANIPTARSETFTDAASAHAYLAERSAPYVVKADGLAAGKGVVIAQSLDEAKAAVSEMLSGRFGEAGAQVVIEEYLEGTEVSLFALTDGDTILPCGAARDHKRAFDGDQGPNTGGMGAYAPPDNLDAGIEEQAYAEIIRPALDAMRRRGTPYKGVLYAGLMLTADGPKLIEFNCRFGDPECQVLMRLLRSDILQALWAAATGRLGGVGLDWYTEACALVVMATKGYPDTYEKGSEIKGLADAEAKGLVVFHAGTKADGDRLLANGGRVLNVTGTGATVGDAARAVYDGIGAIDWPQGFYRTDIGRPQG